MVEKATIPQTPELNKYKQLTVKINKQIEFIDYLVSNNHLILSDTDLEIKKREISSAYFGIDYKLVLKEQEHLSLYFQTWSEKITEGLQESFEILKHRLGTPFEITLYSRYSSSNNRYNVNNSSIYVSSSDDIIAAIRQHKYQEIIAVQKGDAYYFEVQTKHSKTEISNLEEIEKQECIDTTTGGLCFITKEKPKYRETTSYGNWNSNGSTANGNSTCVGSGHSSSDGTR